PMDESLYITVNGEESDGYSSTEIKTEDIVDYINSANDKKVAFIVNYDIKGKESCEKWPTLLPRDLPIGWRCNQHGGTSYGEDCIQGAWRFEGPEKAKEKAHAVAERFYDGFSINITWETNSS
ncbi:unnamed protein product, partial [Adineta ricciae]